MISLILKGSTWKTYITLARPKMAARFDLTRQLFMERKRELIKRKILIVGFVFLYFVGWDTIFFKYEGSSWIIKRFFLIMIIWAAQAEWLFVHDVTHWREVRILELRKPWEVSGQKNKGTPKDSPGKTCCRQFQPPSAGF